MVILKTNLSLEVIVDQTKVIEGITCFGSQNALGLLKEAFEILEKTRLPSWPEVRGKHVDLDFRGNTIRIKHEGRKGYHVFLT